jgi:AcrR family transcriptional regulator
MPTPHADRGPAVAARLAGALELLTQHSDNDIPHQGATVSELCRLAGISRNSLYRYHPEILTALRLHQRKSAPNDCAGQSTPRTLASDVASLQNQLSKLAALVDHYYAAYREVRATLDRRDREISDLRRKSDAKPSPLRR